jgi:hypothetical protein
MRYMVTYFSSALGFKFKKKKKNRLIAMAEVKGLSLSLRQCRFSTLHLAWNYSAL